MAFMRTIYFVRLTKYDHFGLVLKRSPIQAFWDLKKGHPGSIWARNRVGLIWRVGYCLHTPTEEEGCLLDGVLSPCTGKTQINVAEENKKIISKEARNREIEIFPGC
jgi:hypothetical protein